MARTYVHVDQHTRIHRKGDDFEVEQLPNEYPDLSFDAVVDFAWEMLDLIQQDITEFGGTRWHDETVPDALAEQEILKAFLLKYGDKGSARYFDRAQKLRKSQTGVDSGA